MITEVMQKGPKYFLHSSSPPTQYAPLPISTLGISLNTLDNQLFRKIDLLF
jgi:hypothetical protein